MRKCAVCGYQGSGNFCPTCGKPMSVVCDKCQQLLTSTDHFCQSCGAPVGGERKTEGSGPNISFGDVGVMKGSIDASTHTTIGQQNNYHGPVHMNMVPKAPDAAEWMQRGQAALHSRLYEKAVEAFGQAASLQPQVADAHYYLALATLHGNRPRMVSLARIRNVEAYLQKATQVDPACGHAFLLWAILKEDYYVMNHMHQPPPTVPQLLQRVGAVERHYIQEIAIHLSAQSNCTWESAVRQLK